MTILLLGDLTGRSRVALRMLTGELENRGHEVLALPTALISNTLNLGRAAIADTTDYLLEALETWEAIGLSYDLLYIGYVTGLAQAEKLCRVADAARARGVPVVVDPILGDHGKRYNSVSMEQAEAMARLIRHADIITPNLTEACLMTGQPYENADVDALLDILGRAKAHDEEWASLPVLKRYQTRRQADNFIMQSGMDLFYAGFSNDLPPVRMLRNIGLMAAERAGGLKRQALKYALGL